jgi:hypothetical protein
VALRLGFDLDGVLADMEAELVRQSERLFGEPMTRLLQERAKGQEPPTDHELPEGVAEIVPRLVKLQMTSRQERRLWRHVEEIDGFWESLEELEPGVIARLAGLALERRWEVIFLTKRPETAGATAQVQTQRWLEARGFTLPSVFVVQGSRGLVAHALNLDFIVDDRPENCLDVVVDSRARAILVWRDVEQTLPATVKRLGIGIVRSVDECLNILEQVDSTGRQKPGLVDRLKQRLGFAEHARV